MEATGITYEHDTYKLPGKLKEPTLCPQCKAVFHKGRWSWAAQPPEAHETLCPACHRIQDKYPKVCSRYVARFRVSNTNRSWASQNISKPRRRGSILSRGL